MTSFQFNLRRQPIAAIGPVNLTVSIGYDAVGNVATNIDARSNKTVTQSAATLPLNHERDVNFIA